MAEDNTTPAAPAETPHRAPAHDHEFEQLKELVARFGTPVLAAVVIVVLAILAFGAFHSFRSGAAEQASLALGDADTVEEYQRILSDFADTPSAPIAQLGLAAEQFAAGDYAAAEATYAAFAADRPDHPMAAAARIARTQCLEAQGRLEPALEAFKAFLAEAPDSYLAPYAGLGRARCLAEMDRLEEARAAYEDLVAGHPETVWARRAENDLRAIERRLRQAAPAP